MTMSAAADVLTPELRLALHQELHARPPQALVAPLAVTHWVQWIDEAERAASRQYLSELMTGAGLPAPAMEAAFVQADLDAFTLRWELHTEYVAWTVTRALTAEELIASTPCTIARGANKQDAQNFQMLMQKFGADVRLTQH